jgi:alpha-galactosidase
VYYGERIDLLGAEEIADGQVEALAEKQAFAPGNSLCYDQEDKGFSPEYCGLECSALGKGDLREPMVEVTGKNGVRTLDFVYDSHEISEGKKAFATLPGSYDEAGKVQQLKIVLKDKWQELTLELYYWVYEDCNVITRSAVLRNDGSDSVTVERLLSLLVDLEEDDYVVRSFTGAWAREMHANRIPLTGGKHVLSSMSGTSSNRVNPFFFLEKSETSEDFGPCVGFNLIYSGNHYEAMEVSPYGKTRVVSGIQPRGFSWVLAPGERLEAPEAVMTYTNAGRNGMSKNLHAFVREHIVRGSWKKKERPVLLNSWEASYFDFNESKLLKLAEAGKSVGIELFVMDDGWFGKRDDDTSSLGDWTENKKKLPNGLQGLAKKVNALGLDFGIWVEPEMVNVDSELYRTHPEWVMEIPGKAHSEGRNQRVLDLSNPEVQQYIIEEMKRAFSSANIAYVKWDMNRVFSDVYSQALSKEQQGEVAHRYQIGLYHCMQELTQAFPEILFEGCASGGNRFDLGILCYFPQIWASDNTDAMCRAEIQNGYSYGYPQSVMGAHVSSCPNHQTLRVTPLDTRFAVAAFGVLGYECNLCDAKKEDLETIKAQIELYKNWRSVLQFGQWIRGKSFAESGKKWDGASNLWDGVGNLQEWYCVSEDQSREVIALLQRFAIPNNHSYRIRARALRPEKTYRFTNREMKHNIKSFGDLVNTQAPIHIKQDSLLHNVVAKFVKMDGETENYLLRGDVLLHGGVHLKQPYGGTGYNDQVRYFPDFGARMYFVEEETGNENT